MESTCKRDDIIKRDHYGKPIALERPTADKKYEIARIRKYTDSADDVHAHWIDTNRMLIRDALHRRVPPLPTPSVTTLINYRPNWIKKCSELSQFACYSCVVEFGYLHKALHRVLAEQHHCKTNRCPNYQGSMGLTCSCTDCLDCRIHKLQLLSPYDLLRNLCCDSNGPVTLWKCAYGKCHGADCHIKQYQSLLDHGTGCHTFTAPIGQSIDYDDCTEVSDSDMDKKRWIVVKDRKTKPWPQFKALYIGRLREYLGHRYDRDWQNHCRNEIATADVADEDDEISDDVDPPKLPVDCLLSSMDFIHSIRLKPKQQCHSTQTSHYEVQLLAIYDVCVVNGKLQKRGYFYLSDNPHHNWSSAVVAYDDYLRRRKQDFAARGVKLRINRLWSDRGPSDQWCAPFMAFAGDIAYREGILLEQNTSAVRHGKWNHDRIGGRVGNLFALAYRNGKYVVLRGQSPAQCSRDWLHANCRWDSKRKMESFYFVTAPHKIKHLNASPVKTLKDIGVTQYHCMLRTGVQTWFRRYSCSCSECLALRLKKCLNKAYCGGWKRAIFKPYQPYDRLVSVYDDEGNKRKKRRLNSKCK